MCFSHDGRSVFHTWIAALGILTSISFALQGDSGGPLVSALNGEHVIAGIASFFVSGGNARYPSGFSRVSAVTPWIRRYIPGI